MVRHICWPWGNYPGLSRKASCNFKGSNMLRLEMQETQVQSLVRRSPWRRAWQPTPGVSPGNPMDRGAWQATVHGITKSRTWLSTIHYLGSFSYLRKVSVNDQWGLINPFFSRIYFHETYVCRVCVCMDTGVCMWAPDLHKQREKKSWTIHATNE